jgi:hypothetical protein
MLRQKAIGLGFKEVRELVLGWVVGTAWCHIRRKVAFT